MRKRLFSGPLVIVYILFLLLGFGYGYYINMSNIRSRNIAEKKPDRQVMMQTTVYPKTQIVFKTKYMACGHIITTERDANIDEVGMNEEQIKNKFANWQLQRFDNKIVILYRTAEGYCPNHFIIKIDSNGYVGVFKNDADKGLEEIQKTDIFYGSLNEQQQRRLKDNIVVDTEDEVTRVLSDLST